MKNKIILYALLVGVIFEIIINNHFIHSLEYNDYYYFTWSCYLFIFLTCVGLYSASPSIPLIVLAVLALITAFLNLFMIDQLMYYSLYDFRWSGIFNWSNVYRVCEIVIFAKVVLDGIINYIHNIDSDNDDNSFFNFNSINLGGV